MKKLILTLSLFVGMSFVASAQSAASSTDQPKPVIATQQPDQGTVSKATSEAKVEASTEKKCAGQTKACCKSKTETTSTASSCKSKSESGAACCKKKADAKKD
jgi:hypothetical protein